MHTDTAPAPACGTHPRALYRLRRVLSTVGEFTGIEGEGRRFALTALAERLRSDVPGSMRASAYSYGSEQYRVWDRLLDSVRTGTPTFDRAFGASDFDYLALSPEADAVFNEAMTGWTTQVADAVAQANEFSASSTVVDVARSWTWTAGLGCCLLLATILRAHPRLQGCFSISRTWFPGRGRSWRRPAS